MKKFKLVEPTGELGQSSSTSFDWNLCVLCQSVTGEPLQCPNDTKRTDVGAGYKSLATSIEQLSEIGALPSSVRLSDINEGDGVEAAFYTHSAKWHKSCRNVYNKTKVDRALKRKATCSEAVADFVDETADVEVAAEHFTRSSASSLSVPPPSLSCFFCDKPETESSGKLHQATTFELDARVRCCAHTLQDSALIAKLSDGDMIAIEARYYSTCLIGLYRRAAAAEKHESSFGGHDSDTSRKSSLAFAQLVEYISEVQSDSATAAVFKLSELARRYQTRLGQMGVAVDSRIHTTRLKNRLLAHFTGMRAQSCGKEVLLVCDENIGNALSTACQFDSDMDAMHLVRAAHIVRRDMFNFSHKFSGSFANDCQEKSLPQSLTALVQMILEGSSIADISHDDQSCLPATLSISQLLVYNAVKCTRKPTALSTSVMKTRHNLSQETPLPLYLSMMIHAETRKRDIVDKLFSLGLCVSYDRLLQVSAGLANRICDRFDLASGICPPPLHAGAGLFTTAAVDNIDHNPSSTSAQDSFHGTAISLVQHSSAGDSVQVLTTACDSGVFSTDSKTVQPLPKSYTDLSPVGPLRKDCVAPDVQLTVSSDRGLVSCALAKEYNWLEHVHAASKEEPASSDSSPALHDYTWAAYHAGSLTSPRHSSLSVLLPLFRDPAHSTAMICHAMSIVDSAVRHLNPGQVPVLTLDQPVDTDVVVLAIACFQRLALSELWVSFGTGKHLRYFAIHTLTTSLGCARSNALAFFHAFTGCDTVSCFTGHGKKTAWEVWKSFLDITPAFVKLSSEPSDVEPFLPLLERFVVLMYDRTSSKLTVNAQRKHLFTKKGRSMEALPPTQAALLQHTKRAVFQSGYCWYQSFSPQQVLPSPSQWGWIDDGDGVWKPFWTTLPDVAKCCPELLKCGCKTGCGKRCKCTKAKVKCTALCQCDGSCSEPSD